jgi:GTP cyclohydrolase I
VESDVIYCVETMMETLEIPSTEGTKDTPKRVARMYKEMFRGLYEPEPKMTVFPASSRTKVCISGLPVHSMCEHHLLPFFGTCSIAYEPRDVILGLSKFARFVRWAAARPTTQEYLGDFIARRLAELLKTTVVVEMTCSHTCMMIRGALVENSVTNTRSEA